MSWRTQLNGDVLAWLLEPDASNPGVHYFALRDLLDRPTMDCDLVLRGVYACWRP